MKWHSNRPSCPAGLPFNQSETSWWSELQWLCGMIISNSFMNKSMALRPAPWWMAALGSGRGNLWKFWTPLTGIYHNDYVLMVMPASIIQSCPFGKNRFGPVTGIPGIPGIPSFACWEKNGGSFNPLYESTNQWEKDIYDNLSKIQEQCSIRRLNLMATTMATIWKHTFKILDKW